jgi:hypothetical protein
MTNQPTEPTQLTLIDLADPVEGSYRFRLDRDTRLRGLAHIAEIRAMLSQRLATNPAPRSSGQASDRAA